MKKALFITAMSASLLSGCALPVPIILGAAATGSYMAVQERGFTASVTDVKIKTHIKDRLTNLNYKYLTGIGVSVLNGEALITGIVTSYEDKDAIIQTVRTTPDVIRVYDEVMVADAYSISEKSQDAWIATQIKSNLVATADVYAINYMTDVYKSEVFIIGLASTPAEMERALHVIRTIKGVKKVHNYIRISPTAANRNNPVITTSQEAQE